MRSWLFVPGDSERKLAKVVGSEADAVILDLEDSVAEASKAAGRRLTAGFLEAADRDACPSLWVRINPMDTVHAADDLAAIAPLAPTGIVLPKSDRAALTVLDESLATAEAAAGLDAGSIRVVPIATETARGVLELASPVAFPARIYALTWGEEDLAADLGAASNKLPDGSPAFTYSLARSLCQLAAVASGLEPVDRVYTDFRDLDGLAAFARQSCREGFAGMLAIHPAQVPIINAAFLPTDAEIAHAREVLAAFGEAGATGVASIDGRMLDRPHRRQAERVLARAGLT